MLSNHVKQDVLSLILRNSAFTNGLTCFEVVHIWTMCVFSGCSPSERLISRVGGQARSKTPNADMERSVYGADCTPTYLNKAIHTSISQLHRTGSFSSVWQTFSASAANDVAGSAFWGGAWRRGEPEANWTQPERHSGDLSPQPPDCDPQLRECHFLCSAASLWLCRWTASAWYPAVTLLFPVLFSPPAVCLVSSSCLAFLSLACPPALCFSSSVSL